MVGITSAGTYLPIYRLNRDDIAMMWAGKGSGGSRAIAGYDEDTITMATEATLECINRGKDTVDGLFLATTTSPYKEKQSAALVASAVDLKKESYTSDFTNSIRATSIAIKSAIDSIKSGSAQNIVVTASDCRPSAANGALEQVLGDGAASLMIGSKNVIADLEGSYSIYSDFTDFWRTTEDDFIRSAEGRFIEEAGYLPIMEETIHGLLKKYNLTTGDFAKVIYYGSDSRQHANLAKRLGFEKNQVQEPLYESIGNSGTAAVLLMLAACLEKVKTGERILLATYGDGSDAFVFRITDNIDKINKPLVTQKLAGTKIISYGHYLKWRNLIPVEALALPERPALSLSCRWRERGTISALYGVKCKNCGTPQISQIGQRIRVCAACQTEDNFEDYKFSDKKGKIFTYSIDQLQPTPTPPGVNGVVDFDGGGRLLCELTDCEPSEVKIGMPVEMIFRKMFYSRGIHNYFWKAKPVIS